MGDEPNGNSLKKARDSIEYLEEQVSQGKKQGIEFSEVEGLVQGARLMLESNALNDAEDLIGQAIEMASQRFTEFKLLETNIKKLERQIEENPLADASGDGEKSLKMARYHMKTGYYKLGNDHAKRGLKRFTEKGEVEIQWGSGL